MGMNNTPASDRIHIGFFGKRNAGKSSVLNAVTGQNLAVVSDVKGTTTDPVYKAMELLPLGPVMMIDTPGIDDEGELGALRMKKSYQVLNKTDVAVLVVDGTAGLSREDEELLCKIREKKIPCAIAWNKADMEKAGETEGTERTGLRDRNSRRGRKRCRVQRRARSSGWYPGPAGQRCHKGRHPGAEGMSCPSGTDRRK